MWISDVPPSKISVFLNSVSKILFTISGDSANVNEISGEAPWIFPVLAVKNRAAVLLRSIEAHQ